MTSQQDEESQGIPYAMRDANAAFLAQQREEELRARLAAIVECSDDAIISKTLEGVILTWNKGAQRTFGYEAQEVIGKSILILIPQERRGEEAQILGQLQQGERIDHYETVRMHKDGSLINVSLTVSPIRDATGTIVGASKIARDITLWKRADIERERLLESERAARAHAERVSVIKDEFLATLSHELRTPLNAILGWSHILSSRGHADEELAEGLAVIERNTRVQAQLIEDLLDMSRIISGKIRLDVQQVDLQDVVKAAVASIRHAADAKEIRLQVVLDPTADSVRGDPGRLQQCFWNLLSNAVKFTPKGGRIQVTLERIDSHLEVNVADNGQGIKAEFMPHLFERFRQADSSTARHQGGLGLGLSIVKHLVELHGGRVRARSAGENQGSIFSVELPITIFRVPDSVQRLRNPPRLEAPASDHPSLKGIRVLVVDDERDARELVRRVLEECGASVVLASSAREALQLLAQQVPQVILSDIGMPGEDGYQFIRQVRTLPPEQGGRTPAAALTAFARSEDRTRALRAGYQTHVAKPVEPSELTAVVASLVMGK